VFSMLQFRVHKGFQSLLLGLTVLLGLQVGIASWILHIESACSTGLSNSYLRTSFRYTVRLYLAFTRS
jgi:hypothetical protein